MNYQTDHHGNRMFIPTAKLKSVLGLSEAKNLLVSQVIKQQINLDFGETMGVSILATTKLFQEKFVMGSTS